MKKRSVRMLALVAIVMTACSAGKDVPPSGGAVSGAASELTGAGATFPAPLYQAWATQFQKDTSIKVNYQAIGSGGGVQQITARTVDFGASDAPMKDDEVAKAPGIMHIPTVFGAVVVTYNLDPKVAKLSLTPDTVAGIFTGDIKKWNDPKLVTDNKTVNLPASDITVVHRSDGSGTTSIFTDYLSKANEGWKSRVGAGKEVAWPVGLGGKGNDGVTALVKQTPGSIGYVELVFAKENGLPVASIKNRSGDFIEPTLRSTTAAAAGITYADDLRFSVVDSPSKGAYPIVGATWLLVYREQKDEAKARALAAFLKYAIGAGQTDAGSLSYAPLPKDLVKLASDKINLITVEGKPIT